MAVTVDLGRGYSGGKPIRKVRLDWTSDSSGNASQTFGSIEGTIVRVVTNPGSTAPTDNYDMTITDEDGYDILAGQGSNRDTSTTESFVPGIPFTDGTTTSVAPVVVDGNLTLTISNAGATKDGSVVLYVR